MKKIITMLILICIILMSSCASFTDKLFDRTESDSESDNTQVEDVKEPVQEILSEIPSNQDIDGIWINPDYDSEGRSGKVVYMKTAEGMYDYEAIDKSDGSGNIYPGTVKYIERYIDTEGRLCGKSLVTLEGGMSWETLDRINVDGNTLELQSGVAQIDPNGARYSVYYRQ
jgi:hypothetical protein